MEFNPLNSDPEKRDRKFPASMMPLIIDSYNEKLLGTSFIAQGIGPHPVMLLLHGFPGNEVNFDLAHAARRSGWNVVVFHYRGSWGSSGNYSFQNCFDDIDIVLEYLDTEYYRENHRSDSSKLVLAGHSLGGFASIMKLREYKNISHAASFGGFNLGYFAKILSSIPNGKTLSLDYLNSGAIMLNGTSAEKLYDEMLRHSEQWDLHNIVRGLRKKDILLIASAYDNIAPVDIHYKPLINILQQNPDISFSNFLLHSGHSFSDKRIELTSLILNWLQKINF